MGEAFRHDLVSNYFIVKKSAFDTLQVQFDSDFDPVTQGPISMSFSAGDFRILEPGETLFKLAAKTKCKELKT